MDLASTVFKAKEYLCGWVSVRQYTASVCSSVPTRTELIEWQSPLSIFLKWNVDGAVFKEKNVIVSGLTIHDSYGVLYQLGRVYFSCRTVLRRLRL